MATLKDLKLKTGICKRGLKELQSYETEVQREAAKTTAMKERNADPYDLKQQVCVARRSLKLNWSGM
jgi:tubulin-specific chaperone A